MNLAPPRALSHDSAECALHVSHRPRPTYWEEHHIVPRAWQAFVLGRPDVFDPRTAALCRTGHGNVHFWLARLMHAYEDSVDAEDAIEKSRLAVERAGVRPGPADLRMAVQAMLRFEASPEAARAGVTLGDLCRAKLYGVI